MIILKKPQNQNWHHKVIYTHPLFFWVFFIKYNYVFTQFFYHKQDMIQGQFEMSKAGLNSDFPSTLVALPSLKNPVYPINYS